MSNKISFSEWEKEFKRIYDKIKPCEKKLTQKEKRKKLRALEYQYLTDKDKKELRERYKGVYWSKLKKDPERYALFKKKRVEYNKKNRVEYNKKNRDKYNTNKEYREKVLKKNRERYKKIKKTLLLREHNNI